MSEPSATTAAGPQSPQPDKGPQSPRNAQAPPASQIPHAPPVGGPQAASPKEKQPEPRIEACPNCGAPAEPGQLACLSCGKRLELRYRRHPSWRLPAAIIAGVLVLLAIGIGFGLREISSNAEIESSKQSTAPEATTQPTGTGAATTPSAGSTAGSAATPAVPEATGASRARNGKPSGPAAAPTPAAPKTIQAWPAGAKGWTSVLVSADTRTGARAKAREALGRGIPAGVLRSGDFSSLKPGFWVVFAGRSPSKSKADALASGYAAKGFPGAYARFVQK